MFKAEPTLTHYTRPWKERMERMRNASASWKAPSTTLEPTDVYLLNELVRRMPTRPVIVDLAADFTNGSSSLCFSDEFPPALLACPTYPWKDGGNGEWRDAYGLLKAAGALPGLVSEDSEMRDVLQSPMASVSPVCFLLVAPGNDGEAFGRLLSELLSLRGDASVWILQVGRRGDCQILREAERFCMSNGDTHRTVLARDYSPFLFSSSLCTLEPSGDETARNSLEQLSVLFEGNFDFIDLVRRLSEMEMKQSSEMQAFYTPPPRQDGSPAKFVSRLLRKLLKG